MQKVLWLLILAIFTALIFYCSSMPMSESGKLSGLAESFTAQLLQLIDVDAGGDLEHRLRKLTHFIAFVIQGLLLCKVFIVHRISNSAANGYILFLGLLTAVVDEYIQSFSAGRTSLVNDVLLDFSGLFSAWLGCRIWQWSKH